MKRAGSEEALQFMCKDCLAGKRKKPSAYVEKLLNFRALKISGFPIERNDLTVDEWLDLSRIENEFIEIMKRKK